MYGHKQIFQCLGIILMITILNFYRKAIVQNRDMVKMKAKLKSDIKSREIPKDVVNVGNDNVFDTKRHPIKLGPSVYNCCDDDSHGQFRLELCLREQDSPYKCYQKHTAMANSNEREIGHDELGDASNVDNIFGCTVNDICENHNVLVENFVCRNATSSFLGILDIEKHENMTFVGN